MRHPDPVPVDARAQPELPVRGAVEEAGGGGEVVAGELFRVGGRPGVREGQVDHDGVERAVGARIGAVPAVDALGVVRVGASQGARECGLGGGGGSGHDGRRDQRTQGSGDGRDAPQTAAIHPVGCLSARHIYLQGRIRRPHLPCGDLMLFVLFYSPGRVTGASSSPRNGKSQTANGAFSTNRAAQKWLKFRHAGGRSRLRRWLGRCASLYDRHTFQREIHPSSRDSAMRERAVSGHPDSPGRTPGATLPQ